MTTDEKLDLVLAKLEAVEAKLDYLRSKEQYPIVPNPYQPNIPWPGYTLVWSRTDG